MVSRPLCLMTVCLSTLSTASLNLPSVSMRNSCSVTTQLHQLRQSASVSTPSPRRYGSTSPPAAFVDPSTLASAIGTFYQNERFASAFLTCAIKGAAADFLAQSSSKKKEQQKRLRQRQSSLFRRGGAHILESSMDYKRNLAFLLYGGIYQGMGLEFVYNTLFPKWFGDSVVLKVLVSMFILSPLVTLPVAYLVKAAVFGHAPKSALAQYGNDVYNKGLLTKYWSIWLPMQTLAFALIPTHLRITFIAMVSFLWMILFSAISSKN